MRLEQTIQAREPQITELLNQSSASTSTTYLEVFGLSSSLSESQKRLSQALCDLQMACRRRGNQLGAACDCLSLAGEMRDLLTTLAERGQRIDALVTVSAIDTNAVESTGTRASGTDGVVTNAGIPFALANGTFSTSRSMVIGAARNKNCDPMGEVLLTKLRVSGVTLN
ncbi:unnamed protein product [Protopolystoma xenopodis]|uniref:Uncharacterized protein n=1 Tax=Protopolystoma xenopodis TaxID=117903 RepID=A0A448WBU0_9PLAT|nr:unnamed protein product [Protopolystoma xenopodis]